MTTQSAPCLFTVLNQLIIIAYKSEQGSTLFFKSFFQACDYLNDSSWTDCFGTFRTMLRALHMFLCHHFLYLGRVCHFIFPLFWTRALTCFAVSEQRFFVPQFCKYFQVSSYDHFVAFVALRQLKTAHFLLLTAASNSIHSSQICCFLNWVVVGIFFDEIFVLLTIHTELWK